MINGFDAKGLLVVMLAVAGKSPVYRELLTPEYIDAMFVPAARRGRVEVFSTRGRPVAFFTHIRPMRMTASDQLFTEREWEEQGPLLWIADVASMPNVSGLFLGKAIRARVLKRGLAKPGERCIFNRRHGRLGWFTARPPRGREV